MLKGKILGREYSVKFNYDSEDTRTYCKVVMGNMTIFGVAKKHPRDAPNRVIARRVALTDAMKHLEPEVRKAIWGEYNRVARDTRNGFEKKRAADA